MTDHHKHIQKSALSISSKYNGRSSLAIPYEKIKLVKIDSSLNRGSEIFFRRVYIREDDSGSMATVGWILPSDILYCMICANQFGYTYSKINCTACGNVVCSSCVTSTIKISDITYPKSVVVCSQCCWGQEIVDIAPNINLGLPLYVRDLTAEYGPCTLQPIIPTRVLKSRRAHGNCHVFINLCTCTAIPHNTKQILRNGLYSMVCGPESLGVGGVYVYDVAVNPFVLQPPTAENGGSEISHIDLSAFFEQVLKFIERTYGEPISDSYITHSQCTYYRHQLSQVDNQRTANSLDPTLGQISMPIPSAEAFKDLYQIQVKPSDAKNVRHSTDRSSFGSSAASNTGRGSYQSPITNHESVSRVDIANVTPVMLSNRIRSPSISSISSIPVTPFDPTASLSQKSGEGTGESSSSSDEEGSVQSARAPVGPEIIASSGQYQKNSIRSSLTSDKLRRTSSMEKRNEGRELLTPDMLVHYKDKDIDGKSVNILKGTSVRVPKTLVGWQIALLSSEMKSIGVYVVTGIRKTALFKSEYRLSSFQHDDQWLLLKRSPTKKGTNFQPLRKVFTPVTASTSGKLNK